MILHGIRRPCGSRTHLRGRLRCLHSLPSSHGLPFPGGGGVARKAAAQQLRRQGRGQAAIREVVHMEDQKRVVGCRLRRRRRGGGGRACEMRQAEYADGGGGQRIPAAGVATGAPLHCPPYELSRMNLRMSIILSLCACAAVGPSVPGELCASGTPAALGDAVLGSQDLCPQWVARIQCGGQFLHGYDARNFELVNRVPQCGGIQLGAGQQHMVDHGAKAEIERRVLR